MPLAVGDIINNERYEARVICVDRKGGPPVLALYEIVEGREKLIELPADVRDAGDNWREGALAVTVEPGRFKTRDGRTAVVWHRNRDGTAVGAIGDSDTQVTWRADGTSAADVANDDLSGWAPEKARR